MNKNIFVILLVLFSITQQLTIAQTKTENLVVVTLDGMRWEEVFGGADSALLRNKLFTRDSAGISGKFWSDTMEIRRKNYFLSYGI